MSTTSITQHKPFPPTSALLEAIQRPENRHRTIEEILHEIDHWSVQPTVNHFVRKSSITRSLVEGVPVRAVCGARFVVTARGGGRTDEAGAIVCPECQDRYDRMKD